MADRYIEDCLVSCVGSRIGNDNLGTILLLITIVSMGLLYAIVRIVMSQTELGCLTYLGLRFMISSALLAIIYLITNALQPPDKVQEPKNAKYWQDLAYWGCLIGCCLFAYIICGQYGEVTQTAAQASFIMAMYVVMIPLVELAFSNFTLRLPWRSWLAVVLDIPGVILLSGCAESDCFNNFQWGLLLLVAAMIFVVAYYLVTARAIPVIGVMPSIYTSYLFCAIAGTAAALIFETSQWQYPYTTINDNIGLIVATSVLEVLCTMTSTVALSFTSTTRVAIVTSLESLSGAVFGYLIIGESLVGLEYLGGGLMLSAVLVELVPCCGDNESKDSDNEAGVALSESELSELEGDGHSRGRATESSPLLGGGEGGAISEERRTAML